MGKITIKMLDHDVPQDEFDCGNPSINRQIPESFYPTLLQHAYAYQIYLGDKIVGYYMIKFKTITLDTAPEKIGEYRSSLVSECCAVHISYIAIDKFYQNKSIGTNVLKIIISEVLKLCKNFPIALITLDAIKEKYQWYVERGFEPFDARELDTAAVTIPMYMDCILNKEAITEYSDI